MACVGISTYFLYTYRDILLLLCPLTAEESPLLCCSTHVLWLQEMRHVAGFDGFCLVMEICSGMNHPSNLKLVEVGPEVLGVPRC